MNVPITKELKFSVDITKRDIWIKNLWKRKKEKNYDCFFCQNTPVIEDTVDICYDCYIKLIKESNGKNYENYIANKYVKISNENIKENRTTKINDILK